MNKYQISEEQSNIKSQFYQKIFNPVSDNLLKLINVYNYEYIRGNLFTAINNKILAPKNDFKRYEAKWIT